jgi:glycosyltransferase involved in cell wall biosynthesis
MKVMINASNLKVGGGLQVAVSFLLELRSKPNCEFHIVASEMLQSEISCFSFPGYMNFYLYSMKPSLKNFLLGSDTYLDELELKVKPDRVFSIFGPTYWMPKSPHLVGYAKPQYVYTESPFFSQISIFSKFKLFFKRLIHTRDFLKFSNALVAETEDVASRLRSLFPKKPIFTVTNNYNQIFDDVLLWDNSIELPKFDGISLLTISSNYLHKNLQIVPQVTHFLKVNYPYFSFRFILTLDSHELGDLSKDLRENIVFLGKVGLVQCPNLYEQSDFLFLPTLLECFSASYAEAMMMGKPILTSDLSFAHGICGEAALYFDATSIEDIANKIITLSKNTVLQKKLIFNGKDQLKYFDTSELRANKYLKILQMTYNETNNSRS